MITSDRTIARGDELSSERFVQSGTRHNSQLKSDAHTELETVQRRNSAFTSPATVKRADSCEISGLLGRQLKKTHCDVFHFYRERLDSAVKIYYLCQSVSVKHVVFNKN